MMNRLEKLTPEAILNSHPFKLFSKNNIVYFEETTSTNDIAKKLAIEGAQEGTIVIAETQTLGRGRNSRQWESPKYLGIYLSFILRPRIEKLLPSYISIMTGIAAAESIREETGLEAKIKWPNDILINEKKTGGILIEGNTIKDKLEFLIVGIGININNEVFSGNYLYPPTSLRIEKGTAVSRINILKSLLKKIEQWYLALTEYNGAELILKRCKELSHSLGRDVFVKSGNETFSGIAIDIDKSGYLLIRSPNRKIIRIPSGEILNGV